MERERKRRAWIPLAVFAAVLLLLFVQLRGDDGFSTSVSEPGYAAGYEKALASGKTDAFLGKRISDGFELDDLPASAYTFDLTYESSSDANRYEAVDAETGEVLAEGTLPAGQKAVRFELKAGRCVERLTIRTYLKEGVLRLTGLQARSAGRVYRDSFAVAGTVILAAAALLLILRVRGEETRRHLLVLYALCALVSMPLLSTNLQNGHDLSFQLARIDGLGRAIAAGQIPQRLSSVFLYGGGYLSPVMYPEGLLYLPGLLCAAGVSVTCAFKLFAVLMQFASGFLTYLAGRRVGGRGQAFLFAVFYVLCPYRLVDLYLRAALGEFLAMVFLPLAGSGVYLLVRGDAKRGTVPAVLGITGILQSHVISLFLFLLAAFVWAAAVSLADGLKKLREKGRFLRILCAAGVTLLVNLWFLLPFAVYSKWDLGVYHDVRTMSSSANGLFQLFMNGYATGHNMSLTGTKGEMIVSAGLAALGGLALYAYLRLEKKEFLNDGQRALGNGLAVLSLAAVFMSSNLFPWDAVQGLPVLGGLLGSIQFPWRILLVGCPALCLLCALVCRAVWDTDLRPAAYALLALAFLGGMSVCTGYVTENETLLPNKSAPYDHNAVYRGEILYNGQYLLYGDCTDELAEIMKERKVSVSGKAELTQVSLGELSAELSYEKGEGGAEITLPFYDYGLYRAEDGNGAALETGAGEHHLLTVRLPDGAGAGNVRVRYAEPMMFRAAEAVSLLTALLCAAGLILTKRKKKTA